jgi:hypothetical protein
MPASTSRSAARLAVSVLLVLLVLLVCGCAGKTATKTAASTASSQATTTTVAPTTTVQPMAAEESAWLEAIRKLHEKIDKPFSASSINMTRSKMVELGNALAACSRELRRMGSPSDRLQPVNTVVKKACRIYDKGAKCFATAARVSDASGAVLAGSPEERTQKQAMDCGFAAQGNGGNLLDDAVAKAAAIEAQLH